MLVFVNEELALDGAEGLAQFRASPSVAVRMKRVGAQVDVSVITDSVTTWVTKPDTPNALHLNVNFEIRAQLPPADVHGVLGQTLRWMSLPGGVANFEGRDAQYEVRVGIQRRGERVTAALSGGMINCEGCDTQCGVHRSRGLWPRRERGGFELHACRRQGRLTMESLVGMVKGARGGRGG